MQRVGCPHWRHCSVTQRSPRLPPDFKRERQSSRESGKMAAEPGFFAEQVEKETNPLYVGLRNGLATPGTLRPSQGATGAVTLSITS